MKILFFISLLIIYIFFLSLEIKEVKLKQINPWDQGNCFLLLCTPMTFVFALYVLIYFCCFIIENGNSYAGNSLIFLETKKSNDIFLYGYYLPFIIGSIIYLGYYMRSKIYAFLPDKDKSIYYSKKTIYDTRIN